MPTSSCRPLSLVPLLLLALSLAACNDRGEEASSAGNREWRVYLGDHASSHYSALHQINVDNVQDLQVAWTYSTGEQDPENRSQIQCNPIIVDGVLYGTSPKLKLFALNAATGAELWTFDPLQAGGEDNPLGVNRGVVYWEEGEDRRILYTSGPHLFAVNARDGRLVTAFGDSGRVDIRRGLGRDDQDLFVVSNTPGVVYKNLLILGTRVSEGPISAPGHLRAYDVRTGAIVWTFHTLPQPGQFGYDTWLPDSYQKVGGANAWTGMALDPERGVVYVPTGSAAFDFWGGNRKGQNLFANCLLALKADTGERIWHFQFVHHDVWDRDPPAAPNLVTVEREGRRIDAVAQITKSGHVFVFDRDTGEPLFPIEEKPYPASDLKGEETWPTQPLPTRPAPFARQAFTEDLITDRTQAAHDAVLGRFRMVRSGGQFVPPSTEGTIIFPGFDGGGEWGGAGYDPTTGLLYVNSNEMAWILQMVEVEPQGSMEVAGLGGRIYAVNCAACHGADRRGGSQAAFPNLEQIKDKLSREDIKTLVRSGRGFMPSFGHLKEEEKEALVDYLFDVQREVTAESEAAHDEAMQIALDVPYSHTGYNRFVDPDGYPAVKPPWGTLNAINLNTGEYEWTVPLGEYPELTAQGIPQTGTENYGGPVVTAGDLLFIGATKDERFRAFDKRTGKLLWETGLPAGGYATPATYEVGGRQYVVIAAGGGKMGTKSGNSYVAFALPAD
jgi:quinoprotein glucose dehydrogenase